MSGVEKLAQAKLRSMETNDWDEWARRRIRMLVVAALFGIAEEFSLLAWERTL
jgi:hypothetical protein